MVTPTILPTSLTAFAADVRAGLSRSPQKELPSKYFYDDIGSALFEVISVLPEYGLTRADQRLLRRHAPALTDRLAAPALTDRLAAPVTVAELGAGSGKKTRPLLRALAERQPLAYFAIEISKAALDRCRHELGGLDGVTVVGLEAEYLDGLAEVAAERKPGEQLLVLFLGSTIGNFNREAGQLFLLDVRRCLRPGDTFLLGTDLEKPARQLIEAYDDPLGVTAAFNLNLLARINRELGGDFDLSRFEHLAVYNQRQRRIEVHLRSLAGQTITIHEAGLSVKLEKDETIWTESSHKYSLTEVGQMAQQAGFRCDVQWVDEEWPFAESLLISV